MGYTWVNGYSHEVGGHSHEVGGHSHKVCGHSHKVCGYSHEVDGFSHGEIIEFGSKKSSPFSSLYFSMHTSDVIEICAI